MTLLQIDGKKYNEGFLKRLVCKICRKAHYPDLDGFFYGVTFTEEIEKLHEYPEYEDLNAGTYESAYLCHGCINELFSEFPETIQKIEKKFP